MVIWFDLFGVLQSDSSAEDARIKLKQTRASVTAATYRLALDPSALTSSSYKREIRDSKGPSSVKHFKFIITKTDNVTGHVMYVFGFV